MFMPTRNPTKVDLILEKLPLVEVTNVIDGIPQRPVMWARQIDAKSFARVDEHAVDAGGPVMHFEDCVVRPAHIDAETGLAVRTKVWRIVKSNWSRGHAATRWKVGELISERYNAVDGHCLHFTEGEAMDCKKAREAGSKSCIKDAPKETL